MRSSPNEYDVRLGAKIAARRIAMKLTQADLGKALGVSFQQVQKYEKGTNRLPASRYATVCRFLEMPLNGLLGVATDEAPSVEDRLGAVRGGQELAERYLAMSGDHRRLLLDLARALPSNAGT